MWFEASQIVPDFRGDFLKISKIGFGEEFTHKQSMTADLPASQTNVVTLATPVAS